MPALSLTRFFLFFMMVALPFSGSATNKEKRALSKLSDDLKSKYPKFGVALKSSKSTFEFIYDKKTKQVHAYELIEYEYLSLAPNVKFSCVVFYDDFSKVEDIKLSTGGKNVKTQPVYASFIQEGYFHSDTKICRMDIKFPLKGSVSKVVAKKKYEDIKFLTRVNFQSGLPTIKKEIVFNIPTWLSLNLIPFNFDRLDIKKVDTVEKNGTRIITFSAQNIADAPNEELSLGSSYYIPHLLIVPEKIEKELDNLIISSTANLYKWYKGLIDELSPDKEVLRKKVDEIIDGANSDNDKINRLFMWVQENIRYLAYEQGIMGYKPYEAHDVLNKKFGDCKGMANLLSEMLQIAGYDARMTWLGTNDLCYDYSIPSLAVDNHCITTLFFGGKTYFLDATEKFLPFGSVAERIQGRQVMIENGADFILKTIPTGSSVDNKRIQTSQLRVSGSQLSGETKITYSGETRSSLFNKLSASQNDLHQKLIEELFHNADNNIVVNNSNNSNLFDVEKPFEVSAKIVVNNKVSKFEDETFLVFDWDKTLKSAQTKSDRQTDLYFGCKFYIEKNIEFVIPSELKIKHLPKSIEIETPEYSFHGKIVKKDNSLFYSLVIDLKTAQIKKEQFLGWNNAIKQLSAFYDDQIIFIRK